MKWQNLKAGSEALITGWPMHCIKKDWFLSRFWLGGSLLLPVWPMSALQKEVQVNKLTAEKCREQLDECRALKERGYLSINGEYKLQALEIALPVLERQESKRQATLREAVSDIRKLTVESGGYNFEALRSEQDNSDWISCRERTPEPLDWVIAYDEVGTVKAYICQHTGEWIRDNGDELYQVTHWQPLSSPPEDV